MFKLSKNLKIIKGFTLIEMMISVSMLAVLSGVVISTINSQAQREKAEDAVRKATLEKVVEAVESYRYIEGSYPVKEAGNPIVKQLKEEGYLQESVEEELDYDVDIFTEGDNVVITVPLASSDTDYFKYDSTSGKIQACANTDIEEAGVCNEVGTGVPVVPAVCGNDKCEDGENKNNCAKDCDPNYTPPAVCGDGKCAESESSTTCSADCGPAIVCGDGRCETPESKTSCPDDCLGVPVPPFCGDHTCNGTETAQTCPGDCVPTVICGDGVCSGSEGPTVCPADCKLPIGTCNNNGICEKYRSENCTNCYNDCRRTCGDVLF